MIPEVAESLNIARGHLDIAKRVFVIDVFSEAAREAYMTAFHAAQAYVYAQTGKVAKTHSGLRAVFCRIAKDTPAIDPRFTGFLAHGYETKTTVDYGKNPNESVSAQEASEAIETATGFVALVERLCETEGA
ncbi:MAG: HEPN domain-containing protein [Alphaproteobacteria bacterium]|nr:HEPN domain-containing protein [Alphaproteobacteria bacterium]